MQDLQILTEDELQDKIFDIQLCFEQELLTVDGNTSTRPVLLTIGVATCTACIIYDPITKLTLFSHIDESINIETSQTKLLSYLHKKNINLSNIKVFIGGGRPTQPSSRAHARRLEKFWQKQIIRENINTELLLSRDCFSFDLDEAWAYLKKKTSAEELNNIRAYISEINKEKSNNSFLYNASKEDNDNAIKIRDIFINFCKDKGLIKEQAFPLIGIQVVRDENGARILVDLQNPEKSYFPIIGFDTRTGRMFIVNSLCTDLIRSVISDLGLEERYNWSITLDQSLERNYLKSVIDAYNNLNKFQTSSPLPALTNDFMEQHNIYTHYRYNDVFYIPSSNLKKDVRDILRLDRRKLTHVSFDQLSFLRNSISGITIEIDNTDPKSLNALVTFPASTENLTLLTSVIENWTEIKEKRQSKNYNTDPTQPSPTSYKRYLPSSSSSISPKNADELAKALEEQLTISPSNPLYKAPSSESINNQDYKSALLRAISKLIEDFAIDEAMRLSSKESSQALEQQANLYGFKCKNVPGDGNCFFHSVIDQLKQMDEQKYEDFVVKDLIEIAVDHIIQNIELYEDVIDTDIDKFIDKISRGGEWADHIMIQAVASALNIKIVIVRSDGETPNIIEGQQPTATIYLGYQIGLHYQSLRFDATLSRERDINKLNLKITTINTQKKTKSDATKTKIGAEKSTYPAASLIGKFNETAPKVEPTKQQSDEENSDDYTNNRLSDEDEDENDSPRFRA